MIVISLSHFQVTINVRCFIDSERVSLNHAPLSVFGLVCLLDCLKSHLVPITGFFFFLSRSSSHRLELVNQFLSCILLMNSTNW